MKKTIEKNIKLIISTFAWITLSIILTIILFMVEPSESPIFELIFDSVFSILVNSMWWFAINNS